MECSQKTYFEIANVIFFMEIYFMLIQKTETNTSPDLWLSLKLNFV